MPIAQWQSVCLARRDGTARCLVRRPSADARWATGGAEQLVRGVCAVLAALVPPRGKENKRGWKFLGSALPLALRWLAGDPAAPEPVIEDAAWLVREAMGAGWEEDSAATAILAEGADLSPAHDAWSHWSDQSAPVQVAAAVQAAGGAALLAAACGSPDVDLAVASVAALGARGGGPGGALGDEEGGEVSPESSRNPKP